MQKRHGLTLHVRAHEGPVGVVVLQEGDQGGGHGNQLVRRHIHVVDDLRLQEGEVAPLPAENELVLEGAVVVEGSVGLGDLGLFPPRWR